jgi:DNA-binding MarR family transcriptional regulator
MVEHGVVDEHRVEAWRALITAHAEAIGAIAAEMERSAGLPLSSYDVLVALSETPGHRLRMHELARAVILSRSGLTRLVDRLERQGLLVRDRCGTDRRGAYAVLTAAGQEALDRAWPVYGRGIQTHFAHHLTDAEVRVLIEALGRVAAAEGHPDYAVPHASAADSPTRDTAPAS